MTGLSTTDIQPVIIATKLDKINRSQVQKHVKMVREGLGMETGRYRLFRFPQRQSRAEKKYGP